MSLLGLTGCLGGDSVDEPDTCPQVVVFARSDSGTCQSFSTPCDVPAGYVKCCGGLFGGCTSGTSCVDDPSDTCMPGRSADCPGICQ